MIKLAKEHDTFDSHGHLQSQSFRKGLVLSTHRAAVDRAKNWNDRAFERA